jgi:hypothetical protein
MPHCTLRIILVAGALSALLMVGCDEVDREVVAGDQLELEVAFPFYFKTQEGYIKIPPEAVSKLPDGASWESPPDFTLLPPVVSAEPATVEWPSTTTNERYSAEGVKVVTKLVGKVNANATPGAKRVKLILPNVKAIEDASQSLAHNEYSASPFEVELTIHPSKGAMRLHQALGIMGVIAVVIFVLFILSLKKPVGEWANKAK